MVLGLAKAMTEVGIVQARVGKVSRGQDGAHQIMACERIPAAFTCSRMTASVPRTRGGQVHRTGIPRRARPRLVIITVHGRQRPLLAVQGAYGPLRIRFQDLQQGSSRTGGPAPALFPILQGTRAHPDEPGETTL